MLDGWWMNFQLFLCEDPLFYYGRERSRRNSNNRLGPYETRPHKHKSSPASSLFIIWYSLMNINLFECQVEVGAIDQMNKLIYMKELVCRNSSLEEPLNLQLRAN